MEHIYLDHAATTPIRPEVLEAMQRYLAGPHGNASSSHAPGRSARAALEEARERVAGVLGARRGEIVFTGSGTEANNLAILGRWRAARRAANGTPPRVACSAVEHKSVLAPVHAVEAKGAVASTLPVDAAGRVDAGALAALEGGLAVVSVQWGNNEVGTLQPVEEIAAWCRARGVAFHTDAVQAFGHVPVRVDRVPCDLLTVSAHKLGGPVGVGALFVRSGVELDPILYGGGQENGLRPGTSNVAGAIGFAVAAELAAAELAREAARLEALRARLEDAVRSRLPGVVVLAGDAPRLPHISALFFPGVDQELLLVSLDLEGVAASSGSACQSGAVEPSHVITAMGVDGRRGAFLRLSLGRTTTAEEVARAAETIARVVERLRATDVGGPGHAALAGVPR